MIAASLPPTPSVPDLASMAPEHVADRLKALLPRLDQAYSLNTRRIWKVNWVVWTRFTASRAEQPMPTTLPVMEAFLRQAIDKGRKRATLEGYLYTIGIVHRLVNLPNPMDSEEGRLLWRGLCRDRDLPKAQRPREGLGRDRIGVIIDALSTDNLHDVRDRALLLCAFDTMMRRSELVAMTRPDFTFDADGTGQVFLPRSKTDQEGEGEYRHLAVDTVQAVRAWLDLAGIKRGVVWRAMPTVRPRGYQITKPLRAADVARIFKRRAEAAGFIPDRIGAHSTRVGAAQDLISANMELSTIMNSGGWRTPNMVARYGRQLAAKRSGMAQYLRDRAGKLDADRLPVMKDRPADATSSTQ